MAVYTNITKNISTFINTAKSLVNERILQEDGGYIFTESDDRLILEQSVPANIIWNNLIRN